MKLLRRIVIVVNVMLIISLVLGFARQFVDPGLASFLTIFSLLYPYIVIALTVFMILLMVLRSRWFWISCLSLVLTSGNTIRQIGFHVQPELPQDSTVFTLTTLNIKNNFRHNQKDQIAAFIDMFKKKKPTFLLLQEISGEHIANVARLLDYPYTSHSNNGDLEGFLGIFSQYPLSNVRSVENAEGRVIAIHADVSLPEGVFRLINLHLHTNAVTLRAGNFTAESFSRKEGLREFNSMLKSYSDNASLRMEEIELIERQVIQSPYPVILAGDANDTPYSPVYKKLRGSRQNAFVKGGLGFAQTYNGLIIPLKIDHIFMDDSFEIYNTVIEKIRFSDHNPITTSFRFQN